MELGRPHSGFGCFTNIIFFLFLRDTKPEPPSGNSVVAIPTELFPHLMLGYCHEFLIVRVRYITPVIPLCYPLPNKYIFVRRMAQSVIYLPCVQINVIKIISYWCLCVLLNERACDVNLTGHVKFLTKSLPRQHKVTSLRKI